MSEERQLRLDLAHAPSFASEDFLTSPSNAQAHAMIGRWPDWPERVLILVGPAGSGKSHLGTVWAYAAQARIIRAGDRLDPETVYDRAGPAAVLIEDCDRATHDEAAIFHLLNLVRETGGSLLMTARSYPDRWIIKTPDLLSRLRLAPSVSIGEPDSTLMRAVIVKLFTDRQIRIDLDVVAYAVLHCDQSLDAISRFVATVDDDALAEGRRITRPLAARTLARLHAQRPVTVEPD